MAGKLPTASRIVLHIWPGQWGLPSFDPLCVAAVLYLQLAVPGNFSITECSNPDSSPTGQLPFLIHDQHTVGSFPSIVKYVSGLRNSDPQTYPNSNLDANLSPREKAQRTAWLAHAESHLGDLVYHDLYSNQENWSKLTGITLASMFPVPQKYYVPTRIRDSYHQRLLAAGLWKPFTEEIPVDSPFPRDTTAAKKKKNDIKSNPALSRAFEREKILDKARTELDIYQELLDGKSFIFQDQHSSVDVIIAAHIVLLVDPPYPDTLLKDLITESYPTLILHARRIFNEAFGEGKQPVATTSMLYSFWDHVPSWPKSVKKELSPEDIKDARLRWGFLGLVLGSFAAYFMVVVPKYVEWIPAKEHNGEGDGESEIVEEVEN